MQQPIVHRDCKPLQNHHDAEDPQRARENHTPRENRTLPDGTPQHPARWRFLPGPWAIFLIVTFLAGCDNVNWGGAHFAVVAPPPSERGGAESDGEEQDLVDEQPPTGPVLYYVRALEDQALLVPVAEIAPDSLIHIRADEDAELYSQRFITQNLRQGTELALFRHGERAGTFVLQSAEIPGEDACPRIPRATGILELVAGARDATEFLAIAKTHTAPSGRRRAPATLDADRRIPIQASILAERVLRRRGARLPNDWNRALVQLQTFPAAGTADPAFASTFLLPDSTGRGANPAGYALFLIAQTRPQAGYDTTFVDFIDFATAGRAIPRVIDFLDWSHDGSNGLLIEVNSGQHTWFEALAPSKGRWRRILQTRCEIPPPPAATTEETTQSGEP
jgi:hypothetical protein